MQGFDVLFGAFVINIEISTNRPTYTSWKIRNQPLIALTAILSHFPKLEVELELLGSRYNADLASDEMEAPWTRTHQASKSLSSRVRLSATRSTPDDAGEE
jgi:hypothetical protein